MTSKRLELAPEQFNDLLKIASQLDVKGAAPKEIVQNLLSGPIQNEITRLNTSIEENKENQAVINNDEQMARLKKLHALGVIEDDLSTAIKVLVDCFVEHNKEKIEEAAKGI